MKNCIIALDGYAASGKSITAKLLAKTLKYKYIDTGAMYRACALYALQNSVAIEPFPKLKKLIDTINLEFKGEDNSLYINGIDSSQKIREEKISMLSSKIAGFDFIREKMVFLQREMGEKDFVVMDGRDIGTIVFPYADYKFFIIANIEQRAKRRYEELKAKGEEVFLEKIKKDLMKRDENDLNRKVSPLKKAEDAIEIDTSKMTIDEQVKFILSYIRK